MSERQGSPEAGVRERFRGCLIVGTEEAVRI